MTLGIASGRLRLRPLAATDIDRVARFLGDFEVAGMLARVPHPYDRADGLEKLRAAEAAAARWPDVEEIGFAIDHDDGLVGAMSFRALRATPVIGYWLGRPYWGQGLMSEAVRAALGWLFTATGAAAVEASVMQDNPASSALLRKQGFDVIGPDACSSLARCGTVPAIRMRLERAAFLGSSNA
ncbi:GNAT family N-acetyltransferase [Microvirga tunisiensis]|uniref:GNAT family N-acetyltransferase n=1 Tax=Pannonibacter tanglangensis TaxID=2750084 RepID=A0A7X5J945_9HYPH|nr:GNAT family N-acetyltransferase [Pannonibacter sp. XCT-53]NBN79424.1 GNAT family N-acetyltransferase [Pannonibacter sp. XCT-53]